MLEKLEESEELKEPGNKPYKSYKPGKVDNFSDKEGEDRKEADLILEKLEKQEIKKQYPYRTDEDVDARYEIEHMEYRSADIMEALHSGINPSEALKNYKAKLGRITSGVITQYTPPDKAKDMDGYTITEKYDEYGRIISRIKKFDTAENWETISTYTYNSDWSYTEITTEHGNRYENYYDVHGKRISQIYNGEAPQDYSKEKFGGDYIWF